MLKKQAQAPKRLRFGKLYFKFHYYLRRKLRIPKESYEFLMNLCFWMNNWNRFYPSISLVETYMEFMDEPNERNAKRNIAVMIKAGIIREITKKVKNVTYWEVSPELMTKSKTAPASLFKDWPVKPSYSKDFESEWKKLGNEKRRNFKHAENFQTDEDQVVDTSILRNDAATIEAMQSDIDALKAELSSKSRKEEEHQMQFAALQNEMRAMAEAADRREEEAKRRDHEAKLRHQQLLDILQGNFKPEETIEKVKRHLELVL